MNSIRKMIAVEVESFKSCLKGRFEGFCGNCNGILEMMDDEPGAFGKRFSGFEPSKYFLLYFVLDIENQLDKAMDVDLAGGRHEEILTTPLSLNDTRLLNAMFHLMTKVCVYDLRGKYNAEGCLKESCWHVPVFERPDLFRNLTSQDRRSKYVA